MTKNFIELIQKYKIIIPLIQRDYAQGRQDETTKANKFLNAIYDGLKNGLNLDFVYGKTDANIFTPLDGQQRLTTLFLLHWYISLDNEYIEELKKFSYEVRSSTKDFIKELTNKKNHDNLHKNNIKNSIENSSWFFLSWRNDPTILALLNMLELIENIFKNSDINELNNITFELLELNKFNLTDELYVKMNARGKPLTEFENFKAEFEKYIEDDNLKAKLDNQWLDIFWKLAQSKVKAIKEAPKLADEMFYNFFYNITFNFYLEDLKKLKCKINKKDTEFSKIDDFIKECSIFEFYKDVYAKTENINKIILILDNLQEDKYFKIFIEKKEISQWDRARFYALGLGYIYKLDNKEFKRWKRVSFNLINNNLIQSPDDLIKAIKSLKQLIKNSNNEGIYKYIKDNSAKIDYFSTIQRDEESLKAKLIEDNSNDWELELIKAETNWYLNGQVGFLLDYSENNIDKFKIYRDKFDSLWSFAKDNNSNKIMVYQALLTKGNYLPQLGSNYTFCSFYEKSIRIKNDNWRKVFNSDKLKKSDNIYRKLYLKNLLNDTIFDNESIESSLKNIITKWVKDYDDNHEKCEKKYLHALISNKNNIKYCKNLQLRYKNDKEIFLLRKSQMNGTHAELYTWDFFTKYFKLKVEKNRIVWWRQESEKIYVPFKISWYNETSSSSDSPSILLGDFKEYRMKIYYDNGFNFMFYNYVKDGKCKKHVIEVLDKYEFVLEDSTYYKKNLNLCDSNAILSLINNISKDLNNLA